MGTHFYGIKIPTTESLNEIAIKVLQGQLEEAKDLIQSFDRIHIGLKTGGYQFLFDTNSKDFKTIKEFKDYWYEYTIQKENGTTYTFGEWWGLMELEIREDDKSRSEIQPDNYFKLDGYEFSKY